MNEFQYINECTSKLYLLEAVYYKVNTINLVDLIKAKSNNDIYVIEQLKIANENLIISFARKLVSITSSIFGAIIEFIKKIINYIYKILFGDNDSDSGSLGGGSGGGGSSGGGLIIDVNKLEKVINPKYYLPEIIRTEIISNNEIKIVRLPNIDGSEMDNEILKHIISENYIDNNSTMILESDFIQIKRDFIDKGLKVSEKYYTTKKIELENYKVRYTNYTELLHAKIKNAKFTNTNNINDIKRICVDKIKARNNIIINESIIYLAAIIMEKVNTEEINAKDAARREREEAERIAKERAEAEEKARREREEAERRENNREVMYRKYDILNILDLYKLDIQEFYDNLIDFFDDSINNKTTFEYLYIKQSDDKIVNLNQLTDYSFFMKYMRTRSDNELTNIQDALNEIRARYLMAAFEYRRVNIPYTRVRKLTDIETICTVKEMKEHLNNTKREYPIYKSISSKIISMAKDTKADIIKEYEKALKLTEYKEVITIGYQKSMTFFSNMINMINKLLIEILKDFQAQTKALNKGETFDFDDAGIFESLLYL